MSRRIVNRVPTLKPSARCEFTRQFLTGAVHRCTLIAGHDDGAEVRPNGYPHFFTPLSAFDRHGKIHYNGLTRTVPHNIYRGYVDPFEYSKARAAAHYRQIREAYHVGETK
ncbi:hypothetical protein SEA_FORZA_7 [Gordonia phage Forza]|uniref:Uncharacterized protein n=1 Tax=Gordonia phage Forza TaxID=2571247 RepID=A0A650EY68_9CAUD|nr:hypothetical protein PP303_gp007 [Gordonia phage Forza]QEM41476.1 hypothetical protein SEA_BOOPY_7 [Gordonia phage Boopy]QGT55000.1 hypothetical protein SEA_FORZA_7 [Gordonia phage Forza]UXE04150.1 hypothetical protein SEA_BLUENGOLD_6 [Gordonia phage BlueNGold]